MPGNQKTMQHLDVFWQDAGNRTACGCCILSLELDLFWPSSRRFWEPSATFSYFFAGHIAWPGQTERSESWGSTVLLFIVSLCCFCSTARECVQDLFPGACLCHPWPQNKKNGRRSCCACHRYLPWQLSQCLWTFPNPCRMLHFFTFLYFMSALHLWFFHALDSLLSLPYDSKTWKHKWVCFAKLCQDVRKRKGSPFPRCRFVCSASETWQIQLIQVLSVPLSMRCEQKHTNAVSTESTQHCLCGQDSKTTAKKQELFQLDALI